MAIRASEMFANLLLKSFRNCSTQRCFKNVVCELQKYNIHTNKNDGLKQNLKQYDRYYESVYQVPFHEVLKIKLIDIVPKEDGHKFMTIFNNVVNSLTKYFDNHDVPEFTSYYNKFLQYNLPLGKENPCLTPIMTLKLLKKSENISEDIELAHILGICCDMLHMCFTIIDDIIDNSETRRGCPAWHTLKTAGKAAPFDAVIMENSIYAILKIYFSNHHSYVHLLDLFQDVLLKCFLGQTNEILFTANSNFTNFTPDNYFTMVRYKIGYGIYWLPVSATMYLVGIYDDELHKKTQDILIKMACFYQIENDFIDCFGKSEVSGKDFGEDIREGRCSWLIVEALQRASEAQNEILNLNYGRPDKKNILEVYNVYKELDLPEVFNNYRKESYTDLEKLIQDLPAAFPKDILFNIREFAYKTNK